MAFDDLVRTGVALADRMTESLQAPIVHEPWVGQGDTGEPIYAAPIQRTAIVEYEPKQVQARGQAVEVAARVVFLRPVLVGHSDRLTLPDGTTGPLVRIGGLADPDAGWAFVVEVMIGKL